MPRPYIDRDAIFEHDRIPLTRDWAICRYCSKPVYRYENWHVAHEIAYSRWPRWLAWLGRDADWNLGVAHARCNLAHGSENMTFFQSLSLHTKLTIVSIFLLSLFLLVLLSLYGG